MAKVLVVYYSRTGNTEKMAQIITDTLKDNGIEVVMKRVQDTAVEELLAYDGIISGSPTYYGSMEWEMKKFIDESVKFHGKLDGKCAAAFTSAGGLAGGNETNINDMLHAWLIHGMIIQGNPNGDHYGPVAINSPDARAEKQCRIHAERFAALVKKIAG